MFFSVIIPIYNVERYIRRGIECLMAQTFKDFEIVMIDDSSTDGGGKLCDEISRKYANVTVIHQANTGSGGARNAGIEAASGQYLAFYDIDDLVSPDWLERIYEYIVQYHPQLLIYGYREVNTRYQTNIPYRFGFARYESNAELRSQYVDTISGMNFNNGFVWNKVYELRFIKEHDIRFENLRIQQDEVFNLSIYPLVDHVLVVPDVLYEYYVYYNGNTASHYIPDRLDIYRRVRDAFVEMYQDWGLQDERFLKYIYNRFYGSVLQHINYNLYHPANGLTSSERKQELKKVFEANDIQYSLARLKELNGMPTDWMGRMYFHAAETSNISYYQRVRRMAKLMDSWKCRIKRLISLCK